jgi:hypothetical protein
MCTPTIIAIFSLLISGIHLFIQYFYKKQHVTLTVSEAKIEFEKEFYVIKVLALYNNIGNRNTTITNSCLQVDFDTELNAELDAEMIKSQFELRKIRNELNHVNHAHNNKWVEPFTLAGKEQKSIILSYELPLADKIDINRISLRINTCYIKTNGKKYSDCYPFGELGSKNGKCFIHVQNKRKKLKGGEVIETMTC